jgi:hypothetical protein
MNLRKIFTSSILNHQNLKKAFNMGREVEKVLKGIEEKEGEGVIITRSIGSEKGLRNFDPFLLLDQFIGEGAKGFPDHPHRGKTLRLLFYFVNLVKPHKTNIRF